MNIQSIYGIKLAALLTLLAVIGPGCKKFIEIDKPIDTITAVSAFETDTKAASVVRGLYMTMVKTTNFAFGGGVTAALGASADELKVTLPTNGYYQFYINTINPGEAAYANNYWGAMYNMIYNVNQVLENVPLSAGMTAPAKLRFMAEARFIRAANYFYLINLFGDVPKVLTTDYTLNSRLGKSPAAEIYSLIVEDLKYAQEHLDAAYLTTQRVRANKYAATALLARTYLYMGDWTNAAAAATQVIEARDASGSLIYQMESTLNNVFLLGSKEVVLHLLQPGNNLFTWDGSLFVPASATAVPNFQVTDPLYAAFTSTDQRKGNWIKTASITTSGVTTSYHYPNKYKLRTGTGTARTESLAFLRLAELYLIRAEARARLGNIGDALADLEVTRKRAGLTIPLSTPMNSDAFFEALASERFKELFAELGHRWLDLKRTGKADVVLGGKPDWSPDDKLFPIPQSDILANPLLK